MGQRFIVNGINNDKIELVSNYDVRKLNRLLDAKDKMWLAKIKQAREEIENIEPLDFLEIIEQIGSNGHEMEISKKFANAILDKLIAESGGVNENS